MEGVQYPGETIYMPHVTHHAVFNLDQTVAVGDNPLFPTAIEESAFHLYNTGATGYAFVNNSQIYIHKGAFYITVALLWPHMTNNKQYTQLFQIL